MTETLKTRILDWSAAQKDNLIRDLMDLVNIESVSQPDCTEPPFGTGCQKALNWMFQKGRSLGFKDSNYDGYAGSLSLNGEEQEHPEEVTGIWCHLDVVPAGEGWQTPPFEAVYHNGLITGRGSQDNKSSAVLGLYVLKGLRELGISLKHPAALYFGLNEECGMKDLDYFLSHFPAPGLSLIADCGFPACYGEKGTFSIRLISQQKTSCEVTELNAGVAHNIIPESAFMNLTYSGKTHTIHVKGRAGHSAFPKGSLNAISLLLEKFFDLTDIPDKEKNILLPFYQLTASTDGSPAGIAFPDELLGDLTCCATSLHWEDGLWSLGLDIRYPHSMDPEQLVLKLRDYAEQHGCRILVQSHLPSFGFSPEHPVIQKLTDVYNREAGTDAKAYAMAGGTYAAKLPNAIPFGISFPDKSAIYQAFPNGHGDYHQPDESVIADQILQALSIYLLALVEIDEINPRK